MKRCPTCQRVYEDGEMSFCLNDGTSLVSVPDSAFEAGATVKIPASRLTNQSPTEVLPTSEALPIQPSPQQVRYYNASDRGVTSERKPNALPWILGTALILGLSGIVIALIMTRSRNANDSQIAQNTTQSGNTTSNLTASNPATVKQSENPGPAPTPMSDAEGKTPADTIEGQSTPTPKPTQTPRSTPAMAVPEEPALQPTPASTPTPKKTTPVSGGVLNGKAISKPAPAYPAIARAAHASGMVIVQVTIDESGRVISASAVSGHPLLKQVAVQAAYQARFSPTLLSGQPVKVTGVLTYNFVEQ